MKFLKLMNESDPVMLQPLLVPDTAETTCRFQAHGDELVSSTVVPSHLARRPADRDDRPLAVRCGPPLPAPSEAARTIRFPVSSRSDTEISFDFQYVGSPAIREGKSDVPHVVWESVHCTRIVASLAIPEFNPMSRSVTLNGEACKGCCCTFEEKW